MTCNLSFRLKITRGETIEGSLYGPKPQKCPAEFDHCGKCNIYPCLIGSPMQSTYPLPSKYIPAGIFKQLSAKTKTASATIDIEGISQAEQLTPKIARQAANIAFGYNDGVLVWDDYHGYGYRLYKRSARKIKERKP